jgi:WD40 repeat protein
MEIHPPLIELLGAHWRFEVPVAAAAWSEDGSVAAFALGDGSVVLARAEWEGGPAARTRTTGGLEVHPPKVPSPPVSRVLGHERPCRALIALRGAGFLSGGEDGRIVRIGLDGSIDADTRPAARRIDLLAAGPAGWAYASGREVVVTGTSRHVLPFPAEVSALGFDPSGHRLAVAYQDGASICTDDGTPARTLSFHGLPLAIAWSPDGAWLGVGLAAGGVRAWRSNDSAEAVPGGHSGKVRSLGFSADGHLLAALPARRVCSIGISPRRNLASADCRAVAPQLRRWPGIRRARSLVPATRAAPSCCAIRARKMCYS